MTPIYVNGYNNLYKTTFAQPFAPFIKSLCLNMKMNTLTEENYFKV